MVAVDSPRGAETENASRIVRQDSVVSDIDEHEIVDSETRRRHDMEKQDHHI